MTAAATVPHWRDHAIIQLADALSRERALTPDESKIVERAAGKRHLCSTRPWLPKDDAQLRKLRLKGLRAPEIAVQLNRTKWAVYSRIRDLKADRKVGKR